MKPLTSTAGMRGLKPFRKPPDDLEARDVPDLSSIRGPAEGFGRNLFTPSAIKTATAMLASTTKNSKKLICGRRVLIERAP
jgi:hypothetical protein